MTEKRPTNLLFIVTDQQRADTLATCGASSVIMPNLDHLAEQSCVFRNAYVTQPICTPSRASIMTGLYPHTNGCTENNIPLTAEVPTLAEMLPAGQWTTAYYGKWHLGDEIFRQHGFDYWAGIEDQYYKHYSSERDQAARSAYHYFLVEHGIQPQNGSRFGRVEAARLPEEFSKAGFLAQQSCQFIQEHRERPFVLYVNFLDPHPPYYKGLNKVIMLATSANLDGPWTIQPEHVIDLGADDDIDAYNCDTPTAYWFEERGQIVLFYKAYPKRPQPNQPGSPVGSGTAAAVMTPDERVANKLGRILPPAPEKGHWASGWISTPQLFKADQGGWFGLLNGSPTPPAPVEDEPAMREPAPSQGGWIYTPEAWPVSGWRALAQPIEWIRDIPEDARQHGEGVNMWRHHILVQSDGTLNLYYNSGSYGQERLFGKIASSTA